MTLRLDDIRQQQKTSHCTASSQGHTYTHTPTGKKVRNEEDTHRHTYTKMYCPHRQQPQQNKALFVRMATDLIVNNKRGANLKERWMVREMSETSILSALLSKDCSER